MRTLYLDCSMGAAGDMLTAALLELLPDRDAFVEELNTLSIPGVSFSAEKCEKCGILGTHMAVTVYGEEESDHPHHHGHLGDIRGIVSSLPIPTMVKLDILSVYEEIAQAESHVHGVPVEQIHFHEVGTMDAIADVTAVCLLLHRLAPDKIIVSPVHVGSGQVRCAHGILPVPAPATAYLLRGIPIYGGSIAGELCTPTGAALIKHFATEFGEMPVMTVSAIGYGMGKKDFPRANCVRALLGESEDPADEIVELRCNVDDMTGEAIGFALEQLLGSGALDAFTVPIGMKKSRPGVLITVLCREDRKDTMIRLLLKHTTTLGVREFPCQRYTLNRTVETVDTPYGPIRKKVSSGYGVRREKYEYEDLSKIAREQGLSIVELLEKIRPDS
ncbi:MAG: nickel pincer cofactor biosynthesis protein LarC [Candidatus Faecousia sp.]|nr:nickel pincer cofactor biosynthesis protein LarC [Candidatus Faecousia sp.]